MYFIALVLFIAIEIVGSVQGLLAAVEFRVTSSGYVDQIMLAFASILAIAVPCMMGKKVVTK